EEIVPGKPLWYATAMPLGGFGAGVLVESHMGRPTKVEGNPEHPASLGATDVFAQASVLTLYDPDRSKVAILNGRIGSWSDFLDAMAIARQAHLRRQGAGLRILTGTVTSPTLADQLHSLLAQFPAAKWHQYEPVGRDAAREGARMAFGQYVNTVYRFDRADVILALDADFLGSGPGSLRYALAHAMNHALDNVGKTVVYTDPVEANPVNQTQSLGELVADMKSGQVDVLVIVGGNPVYAAPADLEFAESLLKVDLRVHLGVYDDETAELCHWHIPE